MRGNSLGIDVGIEWESGNWTGFPCDLLPENCVTRTVKTWLGWPREGPPLPSVRLRWVSRYCGLYSGRAHVSPEAAGDGGVSPEAAGDGGPVRPRHPGCLVQPERAEGPRDDPAAGVHGPARLQGRTSVQFQRHQAGGSAGGADPCGLAERDRIAEFKEVVVRMSVIRSPGPV